MPIISIGQCTIPEKTNESLVKAKFGRGAFKECSPSEVLYRNVVGRGALKECLPSVVAVEFPSTSGRCMLRT